MNRIIDMVPFADMENEERIAECIREMIEEEQVPDHDAFSKEKPERKKKRKQKVGNLLINSIYCSQIKNKYCHISLYFSTTFCYSCVLDRQL
jgi:hypothetical protein